MKKRIFISLIILIMPLTIILTACTNINFKLKFIVDGEEYCVVNILKNGEFQMPENPQKDGYTFDGWYWDEDVWENSLTINSLLNKNLIQDMKVYAKWEYTDNSAHSFESSVEFGVVQLDVSGGTLTNTCLTRTLSNVLGFLPGEEIKFNFRIRLTSTSAYYLIDITGTDYLSGLTTNNLYYVKNNETLLVSKNATGSDRICGAININETHNVSIPFVVPSEFLFGEDLGNITVKIYAIQQANITMQNAFDVIKGEIG